MPEASVPSQERSGAEIVNRCSDALRQAATVLTDAREVAIRMNYGEIPPSSLRVAKTAQRSTTNTNATEDAATALVTFDTGTTTGGYSNTDHIIVQTGDPQEDRILEFQRRLLRRRTREQPESRGGDRWDKPHKIPGERRRRIVRETDSPSAPPEPPSSGYNVFVGQMTTKLRHDNPNEHHQQSTAVTYISKQWKEVMSQSEKNYYHEMATLARNEYTTQNLEYRATGRYTPSRTLRKIPNTGLWLRLHNKNALERELDTYETYHFPPRPPQADAAYAKRLEESKRRRREKNRQQTMKKRKQDDTSRCSDGQASGHFETEKGREQCGKDSESDEGDDSLAS